MCRGEHCHFHLNLTIMSLTNLPNLVYLTLQGERFITFLNLSKFEEIKRFLSNIFFYFLQRNHILRGNAIYLQ